MTVLWKDHSRKNRVRLLAIPMIGCLALTSPRARAELISVDFGTTETYTSPPASPIFSGAEPAATAANSAFGAANVWNAVEVPEYIDTPLTNPSFPNLVNSTGAASSVGLSFTGQVIGFSGFSNPFDALRMDYLFLNSQNNPETSLGWTITGLTPGATYAFFVYGSNGANAHWNISVDTTGMGNFVQDVVGDNFGTAYYSSVVASGAGDISGQFLSDGIHFDEADWSGFQLVSADSTNTPLPEPSTMSLLGFGLVAAYWRRSRR